MNNAETHRINGISAIRQFHDFASAIEPSDFTNDYVVEEFKKIAAQSFLTELIGYELNQINTNELHIPSGGKYTSLSLINAKNYTLELTVVDSKYIPQENPYSSSFDQDVLILCLTRDGISYSLFQQDNAENPAIINKSKKLTLVSDDLNLCYGECLTIKKHRDVFIYNKDKEDKKIIILTLMTKQPSTFTWTYNLTTSLPEQLVASVHDSRIENVCNLLAELGHPDSVSSMIEMLRHDKHNIRWAAFKSLIHLDFDQGCNALDSMLEDPHPEVRSAAEHTKKLIALQLTA